MRFNNLVSAAISLVAFAAPSDAYWRMSCPGRLISARMDPIVNPGAVSGHVHTISGGNAFNYSMSYADTQTSTCSSCPIKQDLSNYWTPSLYYRTKDGKFINVPQAGDGTGVYGGMIVYYLQRGGPNNDPLKAYPKDFRMIAGNPYKRAYTDDFAGQAVSFVCLNYSGTSNYYNKLPDKPCPDGLRAQLFFPSCWDGVNLDSADHKSHMAYPTKYSYDNGPCPSTHPVHMLSVFFEVIYSTDSFEWWTPDNNWQPFVFSMGDPTGYGFHGDFLNGWDVPTLQKATDQCTGESGRPEDCPVFDFFDDNTSQSCLIAPTIKQAVTGKLDKLPGCNAVQDTNAGPQSGCADDASIGAAATYNTDVKDWDYLGCGIDKTGSRTLKADYWWDSSVTVQSCMNYCGAKGYKYVGLEYGNQCFCDNTLPSDRAPVKGILGNCFTPCAGNSSQYCGGASRLSLYKLSTDTFTAIDTGLPAQIKCPASNGTTYNNTAGTFLVECGMDRGGGDIGMKYVAQSGNLTQCMDLCAGTNGCSFLSLSGSACYMKGGSLKSGNKNSGVNGARLLVAAAGSASTKTSSSTTTTTTSVAAATANSNSNSGSGNAAAAGNSNTQTTSAVQQKAVVTTSSSTTTTTTGLPAGSTSTMAPTCPSSNSTYYQASNGAVFFVECGIDHRGGDMGVKNANNLQQCLEICASTDGCVDVSLSGTACYLKQALGEALFGNDGLRGGKLVSPATGSSGSSGDGSSTSTNAPPAAAPSLSTSSSSTTTKDGSANTAANFVSTSSKTASASAAAATSSSSTTSSAPAPSSTVTSAICPQNNNTVYIEPSTGYQYLLECGIDHSGGDLSMKYVQSFEGCINACATTKGCVDVSLSGTACYMKQSVGKANANGAIRGAKLINSSSTVAVTTTQNANPTATAGVPVARTSSA